MEFKKYRRKQFAELRPVTTEDLLIFVRKGSLVIPSNNDKITVSISEQDLLNGSPKDGDMIARNPKNHLDQWLVSEGYFKDNFEEIEYERLGR